MKRKKITIWTVMVFISTILGIIFSIYNSENPSDSELLGLVIGNVIALLLIPLPLAGIMYFLEKVFRKSSKVTPFKDIFLGCWLVIAIIMILSQFGFSL